MKPIKFIDSAELPKSTRKQERILKIINSSICSRKNYDTDFFYYTEVETDYAVKKLKR